jgi:transposase
MPLCKFCQSTGSFKNGQVRGLQRYRCRNCHRNFTETALRGVPLKEKLKALTLYASGLSMNRIAQLFGVSAVAVIKWIRTLENALCHKIGPSDEDQVIVMEADEFWHFLKKRKQSSGFLRSMIVIDEDSLTGRSVIVLIKPSNVSIIV